MQRSLRFIKTHVRMLSIGVACVVALGGLLLYKLGSLTTNLSSSEVKQQVFSSSWRHIKDDPLNLPYTFVQWLLLHVFSHHGITVTRLTSVFFGALSVAAFAYIVRRWYGIRTAIFSIILFATSGWFLHVSRFAGVDVMYLWAVPTLIAVQIAWERHAKLPWISWAAVAIIALLLYIPGMIWLVLLSFGLHPAQLIRSWQHTRRWWQWLVLTVVGLLFATPLLQAFVRHHSLIQTWVGLPNHYHAASQIGHGLLHSVSFLVYRGPIDPQRWLDRIAVLDIFSIVMLLLGVVFYIRHALAPRTRQLLGMWVIGAIFFALGGPVSYSVLVPIAYLVVTGGIGYLLHEWLRVFPKNTLARATGYSVLGLVVGAACIYQLRSYFVAWPHAPSTISAYHIPRS